MPISKSETAADEQEAGTDAAKNLTHTVQDGLATALEIPNRVIEANLGTSAELLTFLSRRMKAHADLFSGIGHCHDLTEARDMQRSFWENMTKDYSEEMKHLAEMTRKNLKIVSGFVAPDASAGSDQGRTI